jgi:hypothetical protein
MAKDKKLRALWQMRAGAGFKRRNKDYGDRRCYLSG